MTAIGDHQARALLNAPDADTTKGKRDRAILWANAEEKGYDTAEWATYKQWAEIGAQVRKGQRSCVPVRRPGAYN